MVRLCAPARLAASGRMQARTAYVAIHCIKQWVPQQRESPAACLGGCRERTCSLQQANGGLLHAKRWNKLNNHVQDRQSSLNVFWKVGLSEMANGLRALQCLRRDATRLKTMRPGLRTNLRRATIPAGGQLLLGTRRHSEALPVAWRRLYKPSKEARPQASLLAALGPLFGSPLARVLAPLLSALAVPSALSAPRGGGLDRSACRRLIGPLAERLIHLTRHWLHLHMWGWVWARTAWGERLEVPAGCNGFQAWAGSGTAMLATQQLQPRAALL